MPIKLEAAPQPGLQEAVVSRCFELMEKHGELEVSTYQVKNPETYKLTLSGIAKVLTGRKIPRNVRHERTAGSISLPALINPTRKDAYSYGAHLQYKGSTPDTGNSLPSLTYEIVEESPNEHPLSDHSAIGTEFLGFLQLPINQGRPNELTDESRLQAFGAFLGDYELFLAEHPDVERPARTFEDMFPDKIDEYAARVFPRQP